MLGTRVKTNSGWRAYRGGVGGAELGCRLGWIDGFSVGTSDGVELGCNDGTGVGAMVRLGRNFGTVGAGLGSRVGEIVGLRLGSSVGALLGSTVATLGMIVGYWVGQILVTSDDEPPNRRFLRSSSPPLPTTSNRASNPDRDKNRKLTVRLSCFAVSTFGSAGLSA